MILHTRILEQVIDRDDRASFVKELVVTGGHVPLAMVRKRAIDPATNKPAETRSAILLVHGFGQNRYAWHLPSRSLVNHLASAGYDVFNLDLRGHGRSRQLGDHPPRTFDDYVVDDVPAAIEEIQALARAEGTDSGAASRPIFLAGHSLGGLVAYAAAPRLEGAIAGVMSIGSPYHFTRGSSSLRAVGMILRALHATRAPNVGIAVSALGVALRKVGTFAESPLYPIPFRGWHKGSLEPHVLDEHLRLAFDRGSSRELATMFQWAQERRFGGQSADYADRFERLHLPLLVVAGANDDLAPPASVRPAHDRSRSPDKMYRALPLGHIDLLVGRDAPRITWPLLTSWMNKRAA